MDADQIIKKVYESAASTIRCLDVGKPSGDKGTKKSKKQIIKSVYDATTNSLRIVKV